MTWYNTHKAIEYAKRWAYSRNTRYYNFDSLGGDCTNFISQCIYAGCLTMNYTKNIGWYYINLNNRSPSWTGVDELRRFLLNNKDIGPSAVQVDISQVKSGDIIQLADPNGNFYHSLFVVSVETEPLIAAHSDDALFRKLSSYNYSKAIALHILNSTENL